METKKTVRSYAFPCAIYDVVYPGGESGKDYAYVSASAREDGGGRVYKVSLSKGKIVEKLGKTSRPCKLVASASGAFVACVERRTMYVWGVGKDRVGVASRALRIHHTKGVTALGKLCVALGKVPPEATPAREEPGAKAEKGGGGKKKKQDSAKKGEKGAKGPGGEKAKRGKGPGPDAGNDKKRPAPSGDAEKEPHRKKKQRKGKAQREAERERKKAEKEGK